MALSLSFLELSAAFRSPNTALITHSSSESEAKPWRSNAIVLVVGFSVYHDSPSYLTLSVPFRRLSTGHF